MAYVINEPCIGTKDTSCVDVCPVDCINPTVDEPGFEEADQLFIDPEECIDCDACVEACPVDAITPEDMVPPEWQHSSNATPPTSRRSEHTAGDR
jgi:NAD-dependent dihydropyrimidine dehydrogenase PreA subunit